MVRKKDEDGHVEDLFGKLEFVDRPLSSRSKWPVDPVIHMLEEVLPGGKHEGRAVKVPIRHLEQVAKVHMALRNATGTKLSAHMKYRLLNKDTLIVWAVKDE